ncbi:MAG: hypothetical protein KDD02_12145 [Phaeodactylibacter sp.]|nr:hypothetical protein [Phaeodactylibacter sp.]
MAKVFAKRIRLSLCLERVRYENQGVVVLAKLLAKEKEGIQQKTSEIASGGGWSSGITINTIRNVPEIYFSGYACISIRVCLDFVFDAEPAGLRRSLVP